MQRMFSQITTMFSLSSIFGAKCFAVSKTIRIFGTSAGLRCPLALPYKNAAATVKCARNINIPQFETNISL